jgi:hypothetical protein
MIDEIKKFLILTNEDNFKVDDSFSNEFFLERIINDENASNDLSIISACIAYWADSVHVDILKKIFVRFGEYFSKPREGQTIWLELRWYPTIIHFYMSAIAAIDAGQYDILSEIFWTSVQIPASKNCCVMESSRKDGSKLCEQKNML